MCNFKFDPKTCFLLKIYSKCSLSKFCVILARNIKLSVERRLLMKAMKTYLYCGFQEDVFFFSEIPTKALTKTIDTMDAHRSLVTHLLTQN